MNGESENRDLDRDRSRTPSPLSRSSSRGSIGHPSPARTTLLKRNQSLNAKQIRFYRNGDKYYVGLKLAVSAERYKEFSSLLVELSKKIDLPSGAVRCVFDCETGRQITDVTQLSTNSSYVCCSSNNYKELDGGYGQTRPKNWSVGPTKGRNEIKNWDKSPKSPKIEGRREFIKPKLVTVVKNGKPPQKKVTMLLNKKTAVDLNQVLDHLSSKGTLGKVDRLCCLDGREVKGLRDLFNEDMIFIAFSNNERFPDEGFDVDVQSYRITPYRDLKRPCGVKRTSSLRTPRPRRDTLESNGSTPGVRGRSVSPSARTNGQSHKTAPRSKVSGTKKINNGGSYGNDEELYPAAVFQRENSDSDRNIQNSGDDRLSIHGFYKIGRIVGDGNFSVVREGRHRRTGEKYALKIISKSKIKGKEHFIESETEILRRISHPNIVKLYQEYESVKEIFLVLELVTGGDLFDAIVKATKYTERDASHMMRDLVSALDYLHDLKIIHRDIKPENLLVVNNSHDSEALQSLKVADFGLAVEVKSMLYLVCGTPTYVAPEILDESGYEFKADVWAAGVICYILLCGFPPFRSHDQEELFDMILSGDYEFLAPFWDAISLSAKDFVSRMLLVNPTSRYSARDALNHPWIQGHTTKDTNIQSAFASEVNKNFLTKKKHRSPAEQGAVANMESLSLLNYEEEKQRCDSSDDDSSDDMCMPVIDEDNVLTTQEVQYRNNASRSSSNRRKPRPKSLDFQMTGRQYVDFNQEDFELVKRQLLGDLQDDDEYY